jgi:hypothetical protein
VGAGGGFLDGYDRAGRVGGKVRAARALDDDAHLRAANELTLTAWDPVSKQPAFKSGAVRVTRIAPSGGLAAPAPTTTASVPELALPRPE